MIGELRYQLWEALCLNPVWPSDLLENIDDPDYTQIQFFKTDSGIRVELSFRENNDEVKAIYYFDKKELLQKAIILEGKHETILYDRDSEVLKIINQLLPAVRNETLRTCKTA